MSRKKATRASSASTRDSVASNRFAALSRAAWIAACTLGFLINFDASDSAELARDVYPASIYACLADLPDR